MFTPQQIEEISFNRATFGGYDMQSVDEFLEPLTEDYITLYKENALLKSKMRVLVAKLEEYRQNEASMKEAMLDAQKACDQMVKDTEAKCTLMLQNASQAASDSAKSANIQVEEEHARVENAKREATDAIDALQALLRTCLDNLEQIKAENRPAPARKVRPEMFDVMAQEPDADTVPETAEEPAAEPKHATQDPTASLFTNLQFGRNYEVDNK